MDPCWLTAYRSFFYLVGFVVKGPRPALRRLAAGFQLNRLLVATPRVGQVGLNPITQLWGGQLAALLEVGLGQTPHGHGPASGHKCADHPAWAGQELGQFLADIAR